MSGEVMACPAGVKVYLANEFAAWMGNPRFLEALPRHLPGDRASQQRLGGLVTKLRKLAELA